MNSIGSSDQDAASEGIDDTPAYLRERIIGLAKLQHVRSVSAPFQDYALWRELLAIQVERAGRLNVSPHRALGLAGPDSGIAGLAPWGEAADPANLFGGDIHIPYEGVCGADVFVHPTHFGFDVAKARTAPFLSQAIFGDHYWARGKFCKYFLTPFKKIGELVCASREEFGDWVLYTAHDLRDPERLAPSIGDDGEIRAPLEGGVPTPS